ncbi:MAG TPA: U32 family peptidase [Bacillota bacterium]|nr:U32 family peptidase [Bacillota bacterium]
MFRIPELLAPAGGMEQLKAAVENGADAVYMGGKLFNARINAANFSDSEMREAIEYAHLRGVRLHVTMNTLIRDSELKEALEYAALLYEYGADALIIQDLGFARLVRRHIPDFELHLSTQGTVYNIEGAREAKQLGFSRVVLAREVTLEEIREITGANRPDGELENGTGSAENLPEIEVFAHGALCICYSGQCQMSREIGGRSGNRGECAQPCRLPYSICRSDDVSGPCFALSPKDLCTLGQLGQFAEAGVASLKIEGRMKAPEYVAVVTRIYRKYLDLYARYGQYEVEPADLRDLNQIFNRGGFTEGYLFGNPGRALMSGELSKHQGIYIGEAIESTFAGKDPKIRKEPKDVAGKSGNRQRGLVTIRLAEKLSVGDGIEIRSRELPGNLVTFMKRGDKRIDSAQKGEVITVGYIDGMVSPGDRVYKITDKSLMQRARASYEGKSGSAEKALRKMGVSFYFSAGIDRPVSLRAADEEGTSVIKELPGVVEKALNRATAAEMVEAQLGKTGGTPFRVRSCAVELEDGISIPLSKINELRRSVLEELETLRKKGRQGAAEIRGSISRWSLTSESAGTAGWDSERPAAGVRQGNPGREETFLYLYRVTGEEIFDPSLDRIYLPYDAVLRGLFKGDPRIVPVIPNITKGWHDLNIRKNFDEIAALAQSGIAVGNLGWIGPFASAGVKVIGDYGLNLFNSMDFLLARELGVSEAVISHEAAAEDILEMDFHGVVPEVALQGRIPLMTSVHCLLGDFDLCGSHGEAGEFFLKDRKGQLYPVITDPADCRSTVLSYKEMNLPIKKDDLKKSGVYRFRIYAG